MNAYTISTEHDEVTDTIIVNLYRDKLLVACIFLKPNSLRMTYAQKNAAFDPLTDLPIVNIFDLFRVVLNTLNAHTDADSDVPYMIPRAVSLIFHN